MAVSAKQYSLPLEKHQLQGCSWWSSAGATREGHGGISANDKLPF